MSINETISKGISNLIQRIHELEAENKELKNVINQYIDVYNDKQVILDNSQMKNIFKRLLKHCLLYTSPSPRDVEESRMPSSA